VNDEQAKALRAPFPAAQVEQLPKAGIKLDYVSHATTTSRLLEVDPTWTWRPFTVDELAGVNAEKGELWIWLTVAGVTRPGVGDGETAKIRIGDALRNAAMRFGVALDLWAKVDLDVPDVAPAPGPTTGGAVEGGQPPAPTPEPKEFDGPNAPFTEPEPKFVKATQAEKDALVTVVGELFLTGSLTADQLAKTLQKRYALKGVWPSDVIHRMTQAQTVELTESLSKWQASLLEQAQQEDAA
jgi:hypothetical protein